MRLFFAVELPARVQALLGRLNPGDESRDYRWVDPSLLHLTLVFLGQQPDERLTALCTVGSAAASASRASVLKVGAPGSFGPRNAPRVLWIGLDGDVAAVATLKSHLDTGLREAGFNLDDRPFRPHITLARRRESARGGAPPAWPPTYPPTTRAAFAMQQLTLFESRLSPRGATYIPVAHFPLATA